MTTAPVTPAAEARDRLIEAIEHTIYRVLFIGPRHWVRELAAAIVDGPLATALAESTARTEEAGRNLIDLARLYGQACGALAEYRFAAVEWQGEQAEYCDAATARIPALEAALRIALQFVGRAAGEGLSFIADGDEPAQDAADTCIAAAAALGLDYGSDEFIALCSRAALQPNPGGSDA